MIAIENNVVSQNSSVHVDEIFAKNSVLCISHNYGSWSCEDNRFRNRYGWLEPFSE